MFKSFLSRVFGGIQGDPGPVGYREHLLSLYKQEWALRAGETYFPIEKSMEAEVVDNKVRIRSYRVEWPERDKAIDHLRLLIEARVQFLMDHGIDWYEETSQ